MKMIFIPDIHGRTLWKTIVNRHFNEKVKFIFIGDYLDSFDISVNNQILNLLDIIAFKKANPDRVELLWGNHDVQYRAGFNEVVDTCAGYNAATHIQAYHIFKENDRLFKFAHLEDNILATHAGVTHRWFELAKRRIKEIDVTVYDEADLINYLGMINDPLINMVSKSSGGISPYASPLWVRPEDYSGLDDYAYDIEQVVGHTVRDEIEKISTIWNIDTHSKQYLIIGDKAEIKNV